jgi:CO/xanthine dehydrogenase Mo-binding subunit
MLHLKVVFAGRPHARILSIPTEAALAIDGVVAVLTAADVPYNRFGLIDADQPVLCDSTVRFTGDKVALVVARTAAAATAGAHAVAVEYKDLPAVTSAEAALDPGSPLVHAERDSNVLARIPIRKGDIAAGFAAADVVIEETFRTTWQEHAYLQPEAGVAFVDDDGRIVVETAGQWLHEDRRQIAAMLELPEDRVVVRYAAIGGAFGGREDLSIQHLLALAAWKTGRPVAMVWSREESMVGHHKRHPMTIRCRWGATREGDITAVEATVLADGGAYASTSAEVTKIATLFSNGAYRLPNVSVDGIVVYTNNIPSGAFRGFGAPQSQFAAETIVTRLAQAIGMDPVEFRRRNLYREGDLESTQEPLPPGVSILPVFDRCVEEAVSRFGGTSAQNGAGSQTGHWKRGIGLACGIKNVGYSFGFPEQSTATVELFGRGEVERVELVADDSALAPNAGSASASRLTLMAGRAVHDAAAEAMERWPETDDLHVEATVQYRPPATTRLDPATGRGVPNYCYGYAAQAVEVEVNTLTGEVAVRSVISVHDVGKAINVQQVEGQIEGCLAQAVGYALLEDFQIEDGHVKTPFFSTYLLPTARDMPPEIVPVVLELADPNGPYGARGVAEMPLVPFAPAVAAAIHDATGVWLTRQPMTPERVLTAISAQNPGVRAFRGPFGS